MRNPCSTKLSVAMQAVTFVFVVLLSCTAASAQLIALVGGAVIDGTGAERVELCTILIDGERIVAVGREVEVPDGAEVRGIGGKTVIPGLFDMHGHYYGNVGRIADLFEPYALLYLAGGVTTTFSPGDHDPEGMVAFRERVRRGVAPGPRILSCRTLSMAA